MLIARAGELLATVARHAVPLNGLFGRDWHPVTALGVYWLESVLLVLVATLLCVLLARRTAPDTLLAAQADGDDEAVRAIKAERSALAAAHIEPGPVLLFHLGSLVFFGVFLSALLFVMVQNGKIPGPIPWGELVDGGQVMAIVIAIGLMMDLWAFRRMRVDDVASRVNACLARWALLWLLGFAGTAILIFTDRPSFFFGFFAGLKVLFEVWGRLARLFGWKSLKDRQADASRAPGRG